MNKEKAMDDLLCIAHRGAKGHAPENTLLAVRKALAMGATWIEVDVHVADGELVVIHDRHLERTTSGTGDVTQRNLPYLRSLDAGQGEQIPFLREVFDLVAGFAGINVELKGVGTAQSVTQLIEEYVAQKKINYDQILVSSFDHYQLVEAKKHDPNIQIGALTGGIPLGYGQFAETLNAAVVIIHREYVNPEFVLDAHGRGLKVFTYTVNRSDDIKRLYELGVDGIFTDYPELISGVCPQRTDRENGKRRETHDS